MHCLNNLFAAIPSIVSVGPFGISLLTMPHVRPHFMQLGKCCAHMQLLWAIGREDWCSAAPNRCSMVACYDSLSHRLCITCRLLLLGRIVTGIGVGCGFVVAPVYITEITPPYIRGRLTALTGKCVMHVCDSCWYACCGTLAM